MTCEIIVDSCCDMTPQLRKRLDVTSAGEVLIAVKIRELLLEGMSKSHIIQTIHHFIENMKTYFVLERYDNLQKNGRLNRITGKLISVLNIKLVMGSDGIGNIALYAKLKGINQMVEKFLSLIENSGKKTDGENLVISHCNNPGLAERLKSAIEQRYHFKEIFIVPTGGISSLYADDQGISLPRVLNHNRDVTNLYRDDESGRMEVRKP